jgi:predicted O-methyltransferase YrrM
MDVFQNFVSKQTNAYNIVEGSVDREQANFLIDFVENKNIERVLEIGFNGGLSSAAFLSNERVKEVVSFDIGQWAYVLNAKQLIDSEFIGKHTLIIGDSVRTVPKHFTNEPYDLAFIDGGHSYETALADILNCQKIVRKDGFIIIDDYNYGEVKQAYDNTANMGITETVEGPIVSSDNVRSWIVARYL